MRTLKYFHENFKIFPWTLKYLHENFEIFTWELWNIYMRTLKYLHENFEILSPVAGEERPAGVALAGGDPHVTGAHWVGEGWLIITVLCLGETWACTTLVSLLTLTLAEINWQRIGVAAPFLLAFLLADDFHLRLLLAILGDPEVGLERLQPLVHGTCEAPADHGPLISEWSTRGPRLI